MSEQLIDTQILGVFRKNVNTQRGPGVVYEVQTHDGTVYSTFLDHLGQEAEANLFRDVTIAVTVQQNGNFVNRRLQRIVKSSPAAAPVQQPNGAAPVQPVQPAPPVQPVTSHGARDITPQQASEFETKKQLDIHRQVACKVAAALTQPGDSQLDFWANVEHLVQYFQEGTKPLAVSIELADRTAA